MRTYKITLTNKSDMLQHSDNLSWADKLKKWRLQPENTKKSVAGDDRSPAHTWLGCIYHNGSEVVIPVDNLMRCLMEGGGSVPVPGGKNGKSFRAQTQSGMLFEDDFPLLVNGKSIPVAPIFALEQVEDFEEHENAVRKLGFSLMVKRAKIGQSKHVRVRPRFANWSAVGKLVVWDDMLTEKVLADVFRVAGDYKGLGDWRPSSKTPGPFGRFSATIETVK